MFQMYKKSTVIHTLSMWSRKGSCCDAVERLGMAEAAGAGGGI